MVAFFLNGSIAPKIQELFFSFSSQAKPNQTNQPKKPKQPRNH